MFDFEKSIGDWRKQMLAAGIKTPVPLEELEIHLCEEIERQMKSGLGEQSAFEISVQKIGQPKPLEHEFQKIERTSMKRSFLLIVGWLASCFILLAALTWLDFDLNFFTWSPKWDWNILICVVGVLASITVIWFLSKASRDLVSRIVSLFICFFLVWAAIQFFPAEPISRQGGFPFFFGRSSPSPLWYRGGTALLLCLPSILWFWWERRRKIYKHRQA